MTWTDIVEIIKFVLPSLITLLTAYLLLKLFLKNETEKRDLEIRGQHYKDSLPIRLQAYERLTLFLERIAPTNLISRVNKPGMNMRDLQLALISNIRLEYEHNLSQQIYVSTKAWTLMVQTKEEIVAIVNRVAAELPETATGKDLSRGILEYFINNEQVMPTQKALDSLKTEVKKIF